MIVFYAVCDIDIALLGQVAIDYLKCSQIQRNFDEPLQTRHLALKRHIVEHQMGQLWKNCWTEESIEAVHCDLIVR